MSWRRRLTRRSSVPLIPVALLALSLAGLSLNSAAGWHPAVTLSESAAAAPSGAERSAPMAFQLTSAAFSAGGTIPKKFTCDGPDVSPEVAWTEPPAGTQSFAMIMDDPDAPGRVWVHWVLYNLPAGSRKLAEGVGKDAELADGSRQGKNDFGKIGYNGPCPPRGPAHRYFFKLYAVDAKLDLKPGATKMDVERALKGRVLAQAELIGKFGH